MTNKEIAKQLKISPAALSLIINNKPGVSEDTRSKIISQLQSMGMGHLIKKQAVPVANNSICFIIYKRDGEILDLHPFFLLLIEYVENQARSYGYNILISTVDKRKPIAEQIAHLNQLNSQGAIIFATEMQNDDLKAFDALSVPFVTLDNDFSRLTCNSISINNEMGTYQAIEYLISLGHKRIGYLKCTNRISSFKERHKGYRNALTHFNLTFAEKDIWLAHYSEDGSYRDVRKHLEAADHMDLPDAFVCDDDTIASGALKAFSDFNYNVPQDISIIGFNDRPSCEITIPPLTSINVSKHYFASEAVDELLRLIQTGAAANNDYRTRKIRIGTKLVIRSSAAPKKS